MPKAKPGPYIQLDLESLSSIVKKKAKSSNISSSGVTFDPLGQPLQSEGASEMKKSYKSPTEKNEERFNAALAKGMKTAKKSIVQTLVRSVLHDRIRAELNAQFNGRLSPQDIERFAREGSRHASYDLQDLDDLPASVQHSPTTTKDNDLSSVAALDDVEDIEEIDI